MGDSESGADIGATQLAQDIVTTPEPSLDLAKPEDLVRERSSASSKSLTIPAPTQSRLFAIVSKLVTCKLANILSIILVGLVVTTFPREPLGNDLDSSWAAILGFAHQKGLQFGTDIVFTYGPLGFLITPYFASYGAESRWLVDIMVGFAAAAGVCQCLWLLPRRWRSLGLILFVLVMCSIPRSEAEDLLIYFGLFSLGLLGFLISGPRLVTNLVALAVLAVFAALAKFTFFVVAGLTLGAVCLDLALRGKIRLGSILAAASASGLLAGWMISGQRIGHLPAFLAGAWKVSSGYEKSMGLEPTGAVLLGGVVTVVLALSVVFTSVAYAFDRSETRRWGRRSVLLVWLSSLLFVTWKHGFVRADLQHLVIFLGFAPVVTVCLQALRPGSGAAPSWSKAVCGCCCLVAALTLQRTLYPAYLDLTAPFTRAVQNAGILINPVAYWREMGAALSVEREKGRFPKLSRAIGDATVDVFGNLQCYGMSNPLNYRPRPSLQSYGAYNHYLMGLNECSYFQAAPGFVLFDLAPIDHRFAPLEDALLLRDLLINYDLTEVEGSLLLLKSRTFVAAKLTLVREGDVEVGLPVDLSSYGDANIWLQIDVEPTLIGRLQEKVYKSSEIFLGLWRGPTSQPQKYSFRAPAPMLAAGFLASPMLSSTDQVRALYLGQPAVRPTAFSVEPGPNGAYWWSSRLHFRIYKIENALGGQMPRSDRS
jgi:hypothetical protein